MGWVVIWIGGSPGEPVACGRSTGVKLVEQAADAPAFVACTSTLTFVPAACELTVRSARPSASALIACCGIDIDIDIDIVAALDEAASETCAPLTVWTITWVGEPRFGVGFETVALQVIGALASAVVGEPVGVGVGAASSDDAPEPPGEVVDVSDGERIEESADPGATAPLVDVVRLAHAVVIANAIRAPPRPAARAGDRHCDLRAGSIDADATPCGDRSQPAAR